MSDLPYNPEKIEHIRAARGEWAPSAEDEFFSDLPRDTSWIDHELLKIQLTEDEVRFLSYIKIGHSVKDSALMAGHKDYWGRRVLARLRLILHVD